MARDAHSVVVTVHGPLAADDPPVLCRAVEEQLRRHARRVVVDFGPGELGPAAFRTAVRIDRICRAREAVCALVSIDPDRLSQATAGSAGVGRRPLVASSVAAALSLDA